jgi:hypothetical protein
VPLRLLGGGELRLEERDPDPKLQDLGGRDLLDSVVGRPAVAMKLKLRGEPAHPRAVVFELRDENEPVGFAH